MSDWWTGIMVNPWPWWVGGPLIGLLVPLLYYLENTPLGVSTSYGTWLKRLLPGTGLRWLNRPTMGEAGAWRLWFTGGMVLGAFLAARLSGRPLWTMEMGALTETYLTSSIGIGLVLLVGGLLLGLGARWAGGCTSGHSIHGIANLHPSSLLATVGFLSAGALVTHVLRILWLGGGG